jgi:hypothetical protein
MRRGRFRRGGRVRDMRGNVRRERIQIAKIPAFAAADVLDESTPRSPLAVCFLPEANDEEMLASFSLHPASIRHLRLRSVYACRGLDAD